MLDPVGVRAGDDRRARVRRRRRLEPDEPRRHARAARHRGAVPQPDRRARGRLSSVSPTPRRWRSRSRCGRAARRVRTIRPDAGAAEAMGRNLMDRGRVPEVLAAGYAQGRRAGGDEPPGRQPRLLGRPGGRATSSRRGATGPRPSPTGASGSIPEADVGRAARRRRARRRSSSAAAPPTSRPGWRAAARGRSASTSRPSSSPPRARCRPSTASSSRSSRATPRRCRSPTRASTSPSPSTARACGAIRSAGSPRPRGCCAPAGGSSSSPTRRCWSCARAPDAPVGDRAPRAAAVRAAPRRVGRRGGPLGRVPPPPRRDARACSRAHGFEVEALHELQAPPDATTRFECVTLEWARQWPCEEIWVARRE